MDGHAGQTTVLEQSFTIAGPTTTNITFDAALRTNAQAGDGYTVEILDSSGNVVGVVTTIEPTTNAMTGYSIPITFPAAGTYTLRFTEIGNDNSLGALLDDVSILACFLRGSHIETKSGPRKIEDLQIGDLVRTKDHGLQSIRWIGSTTCAARGDMAPILIRKGALGNTRDLKVSPNHRMMLSDWRAEMLFGEFEVLAPAKALVNDHSILRLEGGEAAYFHMMFDQHEIVFSEGVPSESFYPSADILNDAETATRAEILALFPELLDRPTSYGPSARLTLGASELALLLA
ncbi:MAG: Hint domain-containing protein [Rhodobacteraceae bacterium]|nr:Hint domain-containing protein [Paracoccaceae bacterium]